MSIDRNDRVIPQPAASVVNDVDSLYDFIGDVVLCAPDRFPVREYLTDDAQMNIEKAFVELRHGLNFVDFSATDKGKRERLESLLGDAFDAYSKGDEMLGAHLVQDFDDLIYKRHDRR
ncbi:MULTISPECIES: hypothetical protein [Pandoraea]|uniref:hypothetical protein n=1 Tax=Pandoraea TaxID=93217 RepID=UPI001F5CBB11|nr:MULTISPECIES: hypothetical protein [Pandoraea]MCI3206444.1 hypothetical protein [Pandoraea sp. LA3]MDN4584472.1 hypothetical protein [Pandoraea capi]